MTNRVVMTTLLLLPALAYAHNREVAGFISGFTHPILGPDHLLAMLGVGLISARIAGHYIWSIPSLFVSFMVIGGTLGANGVDIPLVEWGIAVSVIILGVANIVIKQANLLLLSVVMSSVAFFGALHGHAHGVEMPISLSPTFYSLGFVLSTSGIHLLGVYIGHVSNKQQNFRKMPSYVGSAMTVAGLFILHGLTQGA